MSSTQLQTRQDILCFNLHSKSFEETFFANLSPRLSFFVWKVCHKKYTWRGVATQKVCICSLSCFQPLGTGITGRHITLDLCERMIKVSVLMM